MTQLSKARTLLLLLVSLVAGCTTSTTDRNLASPLDKLRGLGDSWQSLTRAPDADQLQPRSWEWVTAIPVATTRAEVTEARISSKQLLALTGQVPSVQLAAYQGDEKHRAIKQIGELPIRHGGDLDTVFEAVGHETEIGEDASIRVELEGPNDGQPSHLKLNREELMSLCQMAGSETVVSVTEGGDPRISVRDGSVHAVLTVRLERETGLLQLRVSAISCWGDTVNLPREVLASTAGESLRCLTVAEALDLLYADPEVSPEGHGSWARVSEREDYRIPTNFRRLEKQLQDRRQTVVAAPALASVEGVPYPGSAILGDARALGSFALQQYPCPTGTPHSGWIVFDGRSLRNGAPLTISLNLGNGLRDYRFVIPKS